jgi:hypothetical protein
MKSFAFVLIAMVGIHSGASGQPKQEALRFEGSTPCSNIIRPLNKIPEEADCKWNECACIIVEWKLTLFSDPVSHQPTTFKLSSINRFSVKETNMYSQPGTKAEAEGTWSIVHGTKTDPGAIVYKLNPGKPAISLSFLKLNENLIHILAPDGKLMIGDEFQSYTLNRVL